MLNTKSILAPKEDSDGLRISVMSRHTLNDGKTPHPDITPVSYDSWTKELAPPPKLVGDYYKRNLQWKDFKTRYIEYIRSSELEAKIQDLAERSLDSDITIMCIEETPEHCHRRLLAEECKRYQPDLVVNLR